VNALKCEKAVYIKNLTLPLLAINNAITILTPVKDAS
jgi:hypothetical protein